jgi:hypothetical protein
VPRQETGVSRQAEVGDDPVGGFAGGDVGVVEPKVVGPVVELARGVQAVVGVQVTMNSRVGAIAAA